jgi:hypothetical protein
VFFLKADAGRDGDGSDTDEENDESELISAGDFAGAKQDVGEEHIQQRPKNVDGWRGALVANMAEKKHAT